MAVFDGGVFDPGVFDAEGVIAELAPETGSIGSGYSFIPAGFRLGANGGRGAPTVVDGLDRRIGVNGDYVRTANGEWEEAQDSASIMLIAMSVRLGKSAYDPHHGTSIQDRIESGGASPDFYISESVRVGTDLAHENILTDLVVTARDGDGRLLRDEDGRLTIHMHWRDIASGSPVQSTFTP